MFESLCIDAASSYFYSLRPTIALMCSGTVLVPGAISVKGNQVPPRLFFVLRSRGVLLLSRALPPHDRRKAPDPKCCLFIMKAFTFPPILVHGT